MKKYPMLSMVLILIFFASLISIIVWRQMEKRAEDPTTGEKGVMTAEKKVTPSISVAEKKRQFTEAITPAVHHVYTDLMKRYRAAEELAEIDPDSKELGILKTQYKVTSNEALFMALKPHPQSIAIAQAAMESSWATSRFFKEANNIFGVWSFNKNDQRIAAAESRGDKTIWLKKYDSIEDSIRDYYRTLAVGRAYKEFRILKMETDDPYQLVKKLDRYSEKGAEYGRELAEIIHFNKLEAYDKP